MIGPFGLPRGPEVVFGCGTLRELPALLDRAAPAAGPVAVVTDPGLVACGVAGRVADQLRAAGHEVLVHDGIGPNPTVAEVEAGGLAVRDGRATAIVAVGGGSPIDAAKAIALRATNDVPAAALADPATIERDALPLVAIPTTAGTGAEANAFGVIAAAGPSPRKTYLGHESARPRAALLDPELTVGLPPAATAATGLDVLVHAVESLQARTANPYATGLALEAVTAVARWLPRAIEHGDDLEARAPLLAAAHLAALAMGTTGLGVGHAVGHALTGRHGAVHGVGLAAVFPRVVALNLVERPDQTRRVAIALAAGDAGLVGADAAAADPEAAVAAIVALQERIGLRLRLADLGVGAADHERLAEDALADPVVDNAPRVPDRDELVALLAAA